MTIFTDNTWVTLNGRQGRIICGKTEGVLTEGSDNYGTFLRHAPVKNDPSSTDINRAPPPARSMIALEPMMKIDRFNKRLTQHFGLVVEPGPMVLAGAHCTIAQWNAAPPKGGIFRSPPAEFGIVRVQKFNTDGTSFKINGVNQYEERLEFKLHKLKADGSTHEVSGSIIQELPLVRGQYYSVALAFTDGRGELGKGEFWLGGNQQQTTWSGLVGYPGYSSPYPAEGSYNHAGQVVPVPVTRIYNWREGPLE